MSIADQVAVHLGDAVDDHDRGTTSERDPTGAPANRLTMIQTTTAAISRICAELIPRCLVSSAPGD